MATWKSVEGYEQYRISNHGDVFSMFSDRILKPTIANNGYETVEFYKGGKRKRFSVHRLVAEAFLEKEIEDAVINHIDGNKRNNFVNNLEWVTQAENVKHAYSMGLNGNAKKIELYNIKTELIVRLDSMVEASRYLGKNPNYIHMKMFRGQTRVGDFEIRRLQKCL